MAGRDRHKVREIAIFSRFAKVCGIPIQLDSIKKREPPEPDILCTLEGVGSVAFEMVELISPSFAELTLDPMRYKRLFEEAYQRLPNAQQTELQNRCGNALVHVVFRSNASSPGKRGAIPLVLSWLQELSPSFEGNYYPEARSPLGKVVGKITIRRGHFTGPCFDVEAAGPFADPPLNSIREKFAEPYHSIFPIELLAYLELQPILPNTGWVSQLHTFLIQHLEDSRLRRVWVFDVQSNEVTFARGRQSCTNSSPIETKA